jgi:Icc-related predicted phosphoesterase
MEQTTTSNESTITDWRVALRQAKRVKVNANCGNGDSFEIPVTKKAVKEMIKEHGGMAEMEGEETATWGYSSGVLTITLYT